MEILTGNELLSGATVYLDTNGRWIEDLQQARVFEAGDKDSLEAAMAATKATHRIVSLEIETVKMVDGLLVPDRLREKIRAQGPTAPVFDRQHLGEDDHVSI